MFFPGARVSFVYFAKIHRLKRLESKRMLFTRCDANIAIPWRDLGPLSSRVRVFPWGGLFLLQPSELC